MEAVAGYTDFEQRDGRTFATAHYADGRIVEGVEVRVAVERQITRADGTVEPAAEVASTDDGSVKVA